MRVLLTSSFVVVACAIIVAPGEPRILTASEQADIRGGITNSHSPGLCQPQASGQCSNDDFDCEGGDAYCSQGTGGQCYYEVQYLNPLRCSSDTSPPPPLLMCYESSNSNNQVNCFRARYCTCYDHPDLGLVCLSSSASWAPSPVGECTQANTNTGGY